jgi:hypothetical protein
MYRRMFLTMTLLLSAVIAQQGKPETVLVKYHVKSGSEREMASLIERQWAAVRKLNMTFENPHVVVRGDEMGKSFFVEIFTWRDASLPDKAPAAVQEIWSAMNKIVEARDGRPGIDFAVVADVTSGSVP